MPSAMPSRSAENRGVLVQATFVAGALELARELGCSDAAIARARRRLGEADRPLPLRITMADCGAFFSDLAHASGCDHFGLLAGARYRPADLGAYGYMLMNCATVGEALQAGLRFIRAHQQGLDSSFVLTEAHVFEISYAPTGLHAKDQRQDAEGGIAAIASMLNCLAGQEVRPAEIRFAHPQPADIEVYRRHFRCPVHFGKSDNVIAFPQAVLRQPVPRADPELRAILEAYLQREIDALPEPADPVDRARWVIRQKLGREPITLTEVAQGCRVSARTLQRRLEAGGTGFEALCDEVRQEVFEGLTEEGRRSAQEIAEALGFSDTSGLAKARRRWVRLRKMRPRSQ